MFCILPASINILSADTYYLDRIFIIHRLYKVLHHRVDGYILHLWQYIKSEKIASDQSYPTCAVTGLVHMSSTSALCVNNETFSLIKNL